MTAANAAWYRRKSILAVACLGFAASAMAQSAGRESAGPGRSTESTSTYGTASLTCHTLNAYAFVGFRDDTVLNSDSGGGRFPTAGLHDLIAPLFLPAGAVIDHIELDACDINPAVAMEVKLFSNAGGFLTPEFDLIMPGASGCTRLSGPTGGVVVVDNQNASYFVEVNCGTFGGSTSVHAVRVFYRLKVSPGPAIATFADVPTSSPLFQFVEALASAGITAGCGGGNYCPENPVTRGQMAVFLSSALGLHFPN